MKEIGILMLIPFNTRQNNALIFSYIFNCRDFTYVGIAFARCTPLNFSIFTFAPNKATSKKSAGIAA